MNELKLALVTVAAAAVEAARYRKSLFEAAVTAEIGN